MPIQNNVFSFGEAGGGNFPGTPGQRRILWITGADVPTTPVTIIIGAAGGTSSFGSIASAVGGTSQGSDFSGYPGVCIVYCFVGSI